MADTRRRYERIDIELPCRLFIPESKGKGKGDGLRFESYNDTVNLGLGGVFLGSSFLLRPGVELFVELHLPEERLPIRARIAHVVDHDRDDAVPGMGVEFLDVDTHGRESLLRYFAPLRYHEFHAAMVEEFPHLSKVYALQDVALIVNLWEEWQTMAEGGPKATKSGAPAAPARKRRTR